MTILLLQPRVKTCNDFYALLCSPGVQSRADERLFVFLPPLTSPPVFYTKPTANINEGTEAHREERLRNPHPRAIGTRTIGHAGVGLLPNARSHHRSCDADISIWALQPVSGAPEVTTTAVSRKCPARCPVVRWSALLSFKTNSSYVNVPRRGQCSSSSTRSTHTNKRIA